MGPEETEPSKGRPEVLGRRLESAGREGVVMAWTLAGGGAGSAVEAARADAKAMSARLGTRGSARFEVGRVGADEVEVRGTMGWGAAGARMGFEDVKAALEKEGWV